MGRRPRITAVAIVAAALAASGGCAQLLDVSEAHEVSGDGATGDSGPGGDSAAGGDSGAAADTGAVAEGGGCFIDAEGGVETLVSGQSFNPRNGIAYTTNTPSGPTLVWSADTSKQQVPNLAWCALPGCSPSNGPPTQMDEVVVAQGHVYWLDTSELDDGGGVLTCDLATEGCTGQPTQALAQSWPSSLPPALPVLPLLSVDPGGTTLYFTTGTAVYSIPADGAPHTSATLVADAGSFINDLILSPKGELEVATEAGVQGCPYADGGSCNLVTIMNMSGGALRVADDGTNVYAGVASMNFDGGNQSTIVECPGASNTSSSPCAAVDTFVSLTAVRGGGPVNGLAASGGRLYWALGNGTVQTCNPSVDCSFNGWSTLYTDYAVRYFAFDESSVYFRDSQAGTILRACKPAD